MYPSHDIPSIPHDVLLVQPSSLPSERRTETHLTKTFVDVFVVHIAVLRSAQSSQIVAGVISVRTLAGLVSQATSLVLSSCEDIAPECRTVPDTSSRCSFDERPAASHPVRVAAIDEFVGTAVVAAFGCALTR